MLRIIHNSQETETVSPKRQPSRKEKAMAWMQQQVEADKREAVEKYMEEIKAIQVRRPSFQPFQSIKKAR